VTRIPVMQQNEVGTHGTVDQFFQLLRDLLFPHSSLLGIARDEGLPFDRVEVTLFFGGALPGRLNDKHFRVSAPALLLVRLVRLCFGER